MVPAVTSLNPAVTALDWIIVAFTVLMAVWGYAQGLIVGALSLVGFAAGAFLGSRLGPLVLEEGSRSPYAPLSALVGRAADRRHARLRARGARLPPAPPARRAARGARRRRRGAARGLPRASSWSGWAGRWRSRLPARASCASRSSARRSSRELNERAAAVGSAPPGARALRPVPGDRRARRPTCAPPDPRSRAIPRCAAAGRSVVKVLGTACGLGVQGSGWVAGDGVVVTNAHVVAGQDDTTVQVRRRGPRSTRRRSGSTRATTSRSCARPGSAACRALRLNARRAGHVGGDPRLPRERPLRRRRRPARPHRDGRHPGRLRARPGASAGSPRCAGCVRSGNSGGPMVDARGRVVTTIFAASVSERRAHRLRRARTRSCATRSARPRAGGHRARVPAAGRPQRYNCPVRACASASPCSAVSALPLPAGRCLRAVPPRGTAPRAQVDQNPCIGPDAARLRCPDLVMRARRASTPTGSPRRVARCCAPAT